MLGRQPFDVVDDELGSRCERRQFTELRDDRPITLHLKQFELMYVDQMP